MLDFYSSGKLGAEFNVFYPNKKTVSDESSLADAVKTDYVCAEYQNSRRSNANFIRSNCLAFDLDNDETDDSSKWVSPEDIISCFPDVTMAFHFSRHHMEDKLYVDKETGEVLKTITARPRFHVFFEISEVTSFEEYKKLKEKTLRMFPHFDSNALDSARFFYGTEDPKVLFHQGSLTLTDYLYPKDFDKELSKIKVGSRNSTLSLYAAKTLVRFGNSDEAYKRFLEKNDECEPPLESDELDRIWKSALRFYKKVSDSPDYIPPDKYGASNDVSEFDESWDEPLPIGESNLPVFPVEALPDVLRNYAIDIGRSTQTPVDMAAVALLTTVSACMRNLYKVQGKTDWYEPTNIYSVIIAEPSERKSAVTSLATKPVDEFIKEYNEEHKVDFEMSKATKQKLENKKNSLISQSKKKGESESAMDFNDELRRVVEQLVNFDEIKPMKVYVDDTTPEKLTETLAENNNAISIISSEGGIFDVLSGTYSNKVNIDVFLKAYSGENISVERIMRNSISVEEACLTIFLTVQPVVISELMGNKKFRHRGLTARFLYSNPKSFVGSRSLDSKSISKESYLAYKSLVYNILLEKRGKSCEIITLTDEAKAVLKDYFNWVEKRLTDEYSMYSDWLGKLVGNTLRIAGILARCSITKKNIGDAILEVDDEIVITDKTMEDAVKIGKYFLLHAVNTYDDMGIHSDLKSALKALEKIKERKETKVSRRDIMRLCRWVGSAEEAQLILSNLEDYGYVRLTSLDSSDKMRSGRPKNAIYTVNPRVLS